MPFIVLTVIIFIQIMTEPYKPLKNFVMYVIFLVMAKSNLQAVLTIVGAC